MKFTILINQLRFCELFPTLGLKDAVLISWILDFVGLAHVQSIVYHAKTYYWISHDHARKELPLLELKSADSVYRRMRVLVKAGLLVPHPESKKLQRSYYRVTALATSLLYSSSDGSPKATGSQSGAASDGDPQDQTIKDQTRKDQYGPLFSRGKATGSNAGRSIGERSAGNKPRATDLEL